MTLWLLDPLTGRTREATDAEILAAASEVCRRIAAPRTAEQVEAIKTQVLIAGAVEGAGA